MNLLSLVKAKFASSHSNTKKTIISPKKFKTSTASVLGQPQEIIVLIGSFLLPEDLARAMRVSIAWYQTFSKDCFWIPHIPRHHISQYSPRVEYFYQRMLRNCWQSGEITFENIKLPIHLAGWLRGGAVSPDGSLLLWGKESKIILWRGIGTDKVFRPHRLSGAKSLHRATDIDCGMISPDGKYAFTMSGAGYLVRWSGIQSNKISGTLLAGNSCELNPHCSGIYGGVMTKDLAITFGAQGCIVKWTALDSESTPTAVCICGAGTPLDPHQSATITSCSMPEDGRWILSACHSATVLFRGIQTGDISATIISTSSAFSLSVSRDGKFALGGTWDGAFLSWKDLDSSSELVEEVILGPGGVHNSKPVEVALSSDGCWAITAISSHQRSVVLWSFESNSTCSYPLPDPPNLYPRQILIAPNNAWAVMVHDTLLEIWKPK